MKKRKSTAAQRAALAKGRAALKSRRKKTRKTTRTKSSRVYTKIPKTLEPIIIKEGFMAAKKRKHQKKHKIHGGELLGKSHRKHHRKSRRYHGAIMAGKLDIAGTVQDLAGVAAGAVGSSFVAGMIPVKSAKIKAVVPIALGLFLGMSKFGKSRIMKSAATGALAVGTLSLVKQFFPTLPLLSGADDAVSVAGAIDALKPEERAMLGLAVNGEAMEGEVDGDFEGEVDGDVETYGVDAALSPANI